LGEQLLLHDSNLPDYLRNLGLVRAGEAVAVEKAGDGNINWVRRARLGDGRSWVVKQARPALERFPEYRVSTGRILAEALYYESVAALDRQQSCPRVVRFDAEARVLVLEDLGDAERLDRAQARGADVSGAARRIATFLGSVHRGVDARSLAPRFRDDAMRRLHGDHIFHLPYRENDFPLSPALQSRAAAIRRDRALIGIIDAAHARYLEPGGALVHGDVQSANVLLPSGRAVLLDAEIAHVGDPAFDLGVFAAHLLAPALARGAGAEALPLVESAWRAYCGTAAEVAFRDVARYAGIELLRRTLGAARMPWVERDAAAVRVLDAGLALTARPPECPEELEM
jgi:5-methylthioribose kinase